MDPICSLHRNREEEGEERGGGRIVDEIDNKQGAREDRNSDRSEDERWQWGEDAAEWSRADRGREVDRVFVEHCIHSPEEYH